LFLPSGGSGGSFIGFFLMFMLLFIAAGVGNGSIFRMIPIAFRILHERPVAGQGEAALEEARRTADTEAAVTLGVSSALAAFGGFFIPITYSTAISLSGGPQPALMFFGVFYLICALITWWWYSRAGAEAPC
jgi:NNP family nitrate/nitrite transporter-like MFS transporter